MGITDKSRQQSAKRQQAKQQLNQLKTEATNSSSPSKAEIMAKIDRLSKAAENTMDDAAYEHLTAEIRQLSTKL